MRVTPEFYRRPENWHLRIAGLITLKEAPPVQRKIATLNVPAMRLMRERAGLSLHDLSKRTGIGASSLSRIESGTCDPRLSSAQKICGALDCKMTDLWELKL